MIPATIAPAIGANQNNHNCEVYSPPANKAWLVERAGFTEVLDIGILIKWIKVSPRPIAIGANPLGALSFILPRMINKKNKVKTNSANSTETKLYPSGYKSP